VPIYATEDASDTDEDGLKDWQEVIQGTDPEKSDSDGDGTKDGAEIAAGRNPLKAGPDDKGSIATEIKVGSTEVYNAYVPRSLTDNLSKNLFSTYLQAKSQGGTTRLDDQTLADISSSIAEEALKNNDTIEKYSVSSIGTFPDDDTDQGEAYGVRFSEMYIKMLEEIDASPNDLTIIAKKYETFAKNLTAIYVPKSLAQTQADLGNNFYNMAIMFSIIAKYDQDPIRALLAIRNMKEMLAEQSRMFTAIGNYFIRNDIMFENQDIQRLWANI
jgi:hypothetical protein